MAPAAAATDAQAASTVTAESGSNADASANSAAAAAVPAMSVASHAGHGSTTKGRMSNPYAEVPARGVRGNAAQHSNTQPHNLFSAMQQQQRQADLRSGTVSSAMPAAAKQDAGAVQLTVTQPDADSTCTADLVTTYSSFNHDPVYPYTAFGADPAASYMKSGNLIDPFESATAVTTAQVHAEPHGDATQVSDNFDDMTELQL